MTVTGNRSQSTQNVGGTILVPPISFLNSQNLKPLFVGFS